MLMACWEIVNFLMASLFCDSADKMAAQNHTVLFSLGRAAWQTTFTRIFLILGSPRKHFLSPVRMVSIARLCQSLIMASSFIDGRKSYWLLEWWLRLGQLLLDLNMCHSTPFVVGMTATIWVSLPSLMYFSMSATKVLGSSSHSLSRSRGVSLGSSSLSLVSFVPIMQVDCLGVSKVNRSPEGLNMNWMSCSVAGGLGDMPGLNFRGDGGGLLNYVLLDLAWGTRGFIFLLVAVIVGEGCSSASELGLGVAFTSLWNFLWVGELPSFALRRRFRVAQVADGGSTSMIYFWLLG